jgi:hypothetical protein
MSIVFPTSFLLGCDTWGRLGMAMGTRSLIPRGEFLFHEEDWSEEGRSERSPLLPLVVGLPQGGWMASPPLGGPDRVLMVSSTQGEHSRPTRDLSGATAWGYGKLQDASGCSPCDPGEWRSEDAMASLSCRRASIREGEKLRS